MPLSSAYLSVSSPSISMTPFENTSLRPAPTARSAACIIFSEKLSSGTSSAQTKQHQSPVARASGTRQAFTGPEFSSLQVKSTSTSRGRLSARTRSMISRVPSRLASS